MAIIDIQYQGVLSVASSIEKSIEESEQEFSKLKNRITDMNTVWSSVRADEFKKELDKLSTSLDNLSKKNAAFVSFLQSAVSTYKEEAANLAEAINSISFSSGSN